MRFIFERRERGGEGEIGLLLEPLGEHKVKDVELSRKRQLWRNLWDEHLHSLSVNFETSRSGNGIFAVPHLDTYRYPAEGRRSPPDQHRPARKSVLKRYFLDRR